MHNKIASVLQTIKMSGSRVRCRVGCRVRCRVGCRVRCRVRCRVGCLFPHLVRHGWVPFEPFRRCRARQHGCAVEKYEKAPPHLIHLFDTNPLFASLIASVDGFVDGCTQVLCSFERVLNVFKRCELPLFKLICHGAARYVACDWGWCCDTGNSCRPSRQMFLRPPMLLPVAASQVYGAAY